MHQEKTKIGIIICDRYHSCGGGKCFRAASNRQGAFSEYEGEEIEIAAFAHCGGCPGGNIENVPEEMKKNGVSVVHLATGMLVGYPPCTRVGYFRRFIEERYGLKVVVGTHPIPEKYYKVHSKLGSWETPEWQELIGPTLTSQDVRLSYD